MKLAKFVSLKSDGNMSVNWGDEQEVLGNRKRFLDRMGVDVNKCVFASLVHGRTMVMVDELNLNGKYVEADGFTTGEKGLWLCMVVADCIPLVIWDDKQVGLVHVSRHNLDILSEIITRFGKDLGAWIGPSIKKESYVFENRDSLDGSWDKFIEKWEDGWHIDLVGRVRQVVYDLGIRNIEESEIDTGKDLNYFSHYRSGRTGETEGRFMVVVGLV
jgi:copper oxidase (laccase) domain-containing protein